MASKPELFSLSHFRLLEFQFEFLDRRVTGQILVLIRYRGSFRGLFNAKHQIVTDSNPARITYSAACPDDKPWAGHFSYLLPAPSYATSTLPCFVALPLRCLINLHTNR